MTPQRDQGAGRLGDGERRQARVSTGTISLSAGLPRSTAASRRSTIQARRA